MVSVPGEQDGVAFVRDFYQDHSGVIVTAQVIGLTAAVALLGFVRGLQHSDWVGAAPWVLVSGAAVAGTAVLTAVPPLLLSQVAGSAGDGTVRSLALASDLTDVALFVAIAVFSGAVTVAVNTTWLRAVSAVVALLSGLRAVLLLAGSAALEVAAPMAFIVLVLCLAWSCWRWRGSASE
ncbi:hypothetical protein [Nocardioides mesophilus]|uniref:Uncharacterized protein n=1 Tax=Nocardioides mesophilus TaxID=433659 RepID=A0A7G9REI2_9ACTN|nr:hypothetical protein [Nocardioides mesophilus]QNN54007.1 hypothetical protein H9L09_06405 [Nocardioides mesophilus]